MVCGVLSGLGLCGPTTLSYQKYLLTLHLIDRILAISWAEAGRAMARAPSKMHLISGVITL